MHFLGNGGIPLFRESAQLPTVRLISAITTGGIRNCGGLAKPIRTYMNYMNKASGNRLILPLDEMIPLQSQKKSAREMLIADSQFNFGAGLYAAPAIALLALINGTWTL